jgi:hypothetical protein
MSITTVLKEKWGIEKGNPLFDIETKVAQICTEMSKQHIYFDVERLRQDLTDMEAHLADLDERIVLVSGYSLSGKANPLQVSRYLLSRDVPQDLLMTADGKFFMLTKPKLHSLTQYDEVIPLLLEHRNKSKELRSIRNLLNKCGLSGYTTSKFDSTSSKSGVIWSGDINLANSHYWKYIVIPENKVFLEVVIDQPVIYLLANMLSSEILTKAYESGDGFTYIASLAYRVTVEEVTKEQKRWIRKFIYSRTINQAPFDSEPLFTLVESGSDAEKVLMQIRAIDPLNYRPRKTYYGRDLGVDKIGGLLAATFADFEKLALAVIDKSVAEATPRFFINGTLTFELDKASDLATIESQIAELYKGVVPESWLEPRVLIHYPNNYIKQS